MRLSPLEIRKQEFKKAMRGYDAVEVDTFMEKIAEDFEGLIAENTALNKKLISNEAELKHFKEVEKTLKDTLVNVQENSQLSRENSEKEANLLKKEAELSAAQILEKARQEAQKMREEVSTLRQQKESFIARLRHLLSSQMELLEVLEIDEADISEIKDRTKKSFSAEKPKAKVAAAVKETATAAKPQGPIINDNSVPQKPKSEPKKGHEFFNDIFKE